MSRRKTIDLFGRTEEPVTELSAREQAFVVAYLECWNAAEAARRSGAGANANTTGARMLRQPAVRDAIRRSLEGMSMSANEALTRMSFMAAASMEDFVDDQGQIDLRRAKQRGLMFLVKKYKTKTTTLPNGGRRVEAEVELHDSQAALTQLGRYHGLWVDRTEHSGPNGSPIEVDDVRQRLIDRLAQRDAARRALGLPENPD